MRYIPGLVAAAILLASPAAYAQAAKTGWWIRIDPAATRSDSIDLMAGANKGALTPWMTWKKGDATEFDLPDALRAAPVVAVRAKSHPYDADASFCVFYAGQGIEDFHFDGIESETMRQTDHESRCR